MSSVTKWLLLVVLAALPGCGHHDESNEGHAKHEGHGQAVVLKLNHGEKWDVDEHTRASAVKIADLVQKAEAIEGVDDARRLATNLDSELASLVEGCRMKGAAHDQLHVFLMALFPQVERLKEGETLTELQQTRDEIHQLLVAYNQHFR